MAFIKVQKLVRNEHGEVLSGSAAIMDTVYTPGSHNFSKHRVIESLGKAVYFDKNLKLGIFQSPLRGLVEYCSTTGEFKDVALDDPRLPPKLLPVDPNFHTTFGDVWFLMEFLKKHGLDSVLGGVFQKKNAVPAPLGPHPSQCCQGWKQDQLRGLGGKIFCVLPHRCSPSA